MRILILGATGRVGGHILAHALRDGHEVTALVRTPEKLPVRDDRLTVIQGNVRNRDDLALAVRGNAAVVSALGTDGSDTLSACIPLAMQAMMNEGIRRIVTIGTAGILQSRTDPHLLRYQSGESKRRLTRAAAEHHRVYELLSRSGLDWTIVCPTYLPDGERTGRYRTERDFLPEGGTAISVPDTAEFAYSQLDRADYSKARVGIAY